MKNIFCTIILSFLFSYSVFAEWTYVTQSSGGSGGYIYLDVERVKKHDGYVYFWVLTDFIEPFQGDLSVKTYTQADCNIFRYQYLTHNFFKEPMGMGDYDVVQSDDNWRYPSPNTVFEEVLKFACSL